MIDSSDLIQASEANDKRMAAILSSKLAGWLDRKGKPEELLRRRRDSLVKD